LVVVATVVHPVGAIVEAVFVAVHRDHWYEYEVGEPE
jgi:hypothetical protein